MDGITDSMDMSLSKLREIVKDRECCSPWDHKELDTTESMNDNKVAERVLVCILSACTPLGKPI